MAGINTRARDRELKRSSAELLIPRDLVQSNDVS
jgi:hypothetical protein